MQDLTDPGRKPGDHERWFGEGLRTAFTARS